MFQGKVYPEIFQLYQNQNGRLSPIIYFDVPDIIQTMLDV